MSPFRYIPKHSVRDAFPVIFYFRIQFGKIQRALQLIDIDILKNILLGRVCVRNGIRYCRQVELAEFSVLAEIQCICNRNESECRASGGETESVIPQCSECEFIHIVA